MLQEFMIVPKAKTFRDKMGIAGSTYKELKGVIVRRFKKIALGDEGGFAPEISTAEEAPDLLEEAVYSLGHKNKVSFAIDAAASEMHKNRRYKLKKDSEKTMASEELLDYYLKLIKSYKITSLEDPFEQNSFDD